MEEKNLIAELIRSFVQKKLGDGYTITLKEITKINSQKLTALLVNRKGEITAPSIYIDEMVHAVSNGAEMGAVVDKIIQIYRNSLPMQFDISSFQDFDWVKGRVIYQMVNTALNKGLLEDIPHIPVLDLSLIFKVALDYESDDIATILIHNCHLETWGVPVETLYKLAVENTPRLFPVEIRSMQEIIGRYCPGGGIPLPEEAPPMHVLSNSKNLYGSCCINYQNILPDFARKQGSDLYILPSSVHEVILLPVPDKAPSLLKEMIATVNQTEVSIDLYKKTTQNKRKFADYYNRSKMKRIWYLAEKIALYQNRFFCIINMLLI